MDFEVEFLLLEVELDNGFIIEINNLFEVGYKEKLFVYLRFFYLDVLNISVLIFEGLIEGLVKLVDY